MKMRWQTLRKWIWSLNSPYQNFVIWKFSWKFEKKISLIIWLFNFDYLPDGDEEKVDAKNENEDEKYWKNELDFWIFHIKIRFYGNCHENLRKKNWLIFKVIFD